MPPPGWSGLHLILLLAFLETAKTGGIIESPFSRD